jgi:hypothetical protein
MLKDLKFDAFEGPGWAYSNMSHMSSESVAHVPEALASPSKAAYHRAFIRGHLKTRHIRSHTEVLRDARRFFIELCVNPHPRTHNILVNGADNQRQTADLSDYNVAHNSQNNPEFCRKPICFISRSGVL